MPIYEYRCSDCKYEFETIQKVGARPLRKCPECEGKLEKLISRASFLLKGGGWFDQGYSGKPNSGTDGESSEKTSAKDSKKGESRPDAKPKSKDSTKGKAAATA